jgi:AraC-like DNA-binding protein
MMLFYTKVPLEIYRADDKDFPAAFEAFLIPNTLQYYARDYPGIFCCQRHIAGKMSFTKLDLECSQVYQLPAKPEVAAFFLSMALQGNWYAYLDQYRATELQEGQCQMAWYDVNELTLLLPPSRYQGCQVCITREVMEQLAAKNQAVQWLLLYAGDLLQQLAHTVPISPEMQSQYYAIVQCLHTGTAKQAMLEREMATLVTLYAVALYKQVHPPAAVDGESFTDRITEYIRHHIHDHIPLPRLATHLGMSASVLRRTAVRELGMPPAKFIMLQRRKRAAELLVQTNLSFKEIANYTGFTDRAHFYREFKKGMGCKPSDYRKQYQG